MSKYNKLIANSITYFILIGLLIIATFFDKQISEMLYIGGGISVVGAVVGKMPSWIMACMASGILFKSALHKEKRYKGRLFLVVAYGLLAFACGFVLGISAVEDVISGMYKYIVAGAICLLAGSCTLLVANRISLDYIAKLKKWAFFALISVAVLTAITLLIKIGWGRERYVDIVNMGKEFTPWYLPQGMSSGGTSMPSGHTALAAGMFLLPLLYLSLPNMKQYAMSTYILAWVITVFVAITRMMGGYHFLSDVVISIIIAYTVIICVYYIGYGKKLSRTLIEDKSFLSKF